MGCWQPPGAELTGPSARRTPRRRVQPERYAGIRIVDIGVPDINGRLFFGNRVSSTGVRLHYTAHRAALRHGT